MKNSSLTVAIVLQILLTATGAAGPGRIITYMQVEQALARGFNPSSVTSDGFKFPILLVAIHQRDAGIIRLLLSHGANPNQTDRRGTPLLISAISSFKPSSDNSDLLNAIHILLDHPGLDVSAKDRASVGDGRTALHQAASLGWTEMVDLLLKKGAFVNLTNRFNETPLHSAAESGKIEIIEKLLAYGAEPTIRSKHTRMTPSLVAAFHGHKEATLKLLAKHTVSQDVFGKTESDLLSEKGNQDTFLR